jgi:hypothetical protein
MKRPGIFNSVRMLFILNVLTKDKQQHHQSFSLTNEKSKW